MSTWNQDPNKRAVAIIRRSSAAQKENTSADTQEREIKAYCDRHGLEIIKQESIIETAYQADERKRYKALMAYALKNEIKHVLFYIGSREARNLTDNERNEQLVKSGTLVIHHVSDGKVYWKGSPDSDFLTRDLMASVNKQQSRENGTKMKAAYKTKAENGWWPYRHTPLGYVHCKDKDALGNPIKGTARLIRDPNEANVKLVQQEFRLRSEGYSLDQIRDRNIQDGLVSFDRIKAYSRHAIEERLKNPLYWGYFYLTDDPRRYDGKHPLIIDPKTLSAVEAINSGRKSKRKTTNGDDVFRGWLTCGHPECQRAMTYDPKEKTLKGTGEKVIYHYYRCSNSRKIHESVKSVPEQKIWDQFEPAIDALTITEEFAKDIAAALNETHEKQKAAIRKQMEGFRVERDKLRSERNGAVAMFASGKIREIEYAEFIKDIDRRDDHFANEVERLTLSISDEAMVSVQKVFELAINAKSLWKSMEREKRLEYLKLVCSNPTLDELTLQYQLEKPFARLATWKQNPEWRREVAEFRTESIAWAA